jgi:hypothetical protein
MVQYFLDVRDMSFINEYNQSNTTGVPKYYANWDENTVIVAPTPDQAYTIQLNYILKPTGLSSYNCNYIFKSTISQWLIICLPS